MIDNLRNYAFIRERVQKVPYNFAKTKRALPLAEEEGAILVAVENSADLEVLEELRFLLKAPIRELSVTKEALDTAIEICFHQTHDATASLIAHLKEESLHTGIQLEGYDLLDQTAETPVVKLLNLMIAEAIQQGASDIHFEPSYQGLTVRYRIDGVLQRRHAPPKEIQAPLISRIKVLARLDIAEQRLPQDGRIKLSFGGREIDFRVSTAPVLDGERVVMRILDKSTVTLGLAHLGMPPPLQARLSAIIRKTEGMILVTGPTGSGKTTTLYSAISDIAVSDLNIMTIEDPVEYKLPHIAQMGINPKIGLTFSTGLKHLLRQDPDVMMVGEIRDQETAEIAIQASLTGHLVLSTLHTNDAPSAITRLVDMGILPYLLSSSLIAVLAQRLVRANCPHCLAPYTPTHQESAYLNLPPNQKFVKGAGCAHCFGVGYRCRLALYELMELTPTLQEAMQKTVAASHLRTLALQDGMTPLLASGRALIQTGLTTPAEVLRVCQGAHHAAL